MRAAPAESKQTLFHARYRNGELADRHVFRVVAQPLAGHEYRNVSVADDIETPVEPVRYSFRSFDRQWIIPDNRLLNQANPVLWSSASPHQVYVAALVRTSPTAGPAIGLSAGVPDHDYYKGSFGGRVYPLWADAEARTSNVSASVRTLLARTLGVAVTGEDVLAYIAAVAAHPGYTARFTPDLVQPGLRIPLTADAALFSEAVTIGREIVWLHTYGERCADPAAGRPPGPPRLPADRAPRIPADGAIPRSPEYMPDRIDHDATLGRLYVGGGFVDGVTRAMWEYEVSGKQVVKQWFSYRRKTRERPIIGDRRPPSPLGDIQPDHWLPEYTTDLLDLLHVLGRLIDLEPAQAALLDRICLGPLVRAADVAAAAPATPAPAAPRGRTRRRDAAQTSLLD